MGLLDSLRKEEKQDECEAWKTEWQQLRGTGLVCRIEQTANNLGTHYREQGTRDQRDLNFDTALEEITLPRCTLKALREEVSTED